MNKWLLALNTSTYNPCFLRDERSEYPPINICYTATNYGVNTMPEFINIADLKDPNDPQGRTYRQVNNATPHKFGVGVLVELDSGVRLFTAKLTRDCDGTPLYSLTHQTRDDDYPLNELYWVHGFSEDGMKAV